jgi:hypothetical protein
LPDAQRSVEKIEKTAQQRNLRLTAVVETSASGLFVGRVAHEAVQYGFGYVSPYIFPSAKPVYTL